MRHFIIGVGAGILAMVCGEFAQAGTLTIVSNGSTQAAGLGPGVPSSSQEAILDSGNTVGLTFTPALLVGPSGTFTPVPTGAPAGTEVINIAPGDGESGYFQVTFTLPSGYWNPMLAGAGNVDDYGTVFLNGHAISAINALDEYDSVSFSTSNASYFQTGTNVLLFSDSNSGGGPSGASFYANVAFSGSVLPEPSSLTLLSFSIAGIGVYAWRCGKRAKT